VATVDRDSDSGGAETTNRCNDRHNREWVTPRSLVHVGSLSDDPWVGCIIRQPDEAVNPL
jgi:hypothetical protein